MNPDASGCRLVERSAAASGGASQHLRGRSTEWCATPNSSSTLLLATGGPRDMEAAPLGAEDGLSSAASLQELNTLNKTPPNGESAEVSAAPISSSSRGPVAPSPVVRSVTLQIGVRDHCLVRTAGVLCPHARPPQPLPYSHLNLKTGSCAGWTRMERAKGMPAARSERWAHRRRPPTRLWAAPELTVPALSAPQERKKETRHACLRDLFKLPAQEGYIGEFNCALQKRVLLQGRLYLFNSYGALASLN